MNPKNFSDGMHAMGGGLYLRVRDGHRLWLIRVQIRGRHIKRSLGSYPALSLSAARDRAAALIQRLKDGDPVDAPAPKVSPRLADIFEEAIANRRRIKAWTNQKAEDQWFTTFRQYVLPSLGAMPVDEISRDDVLAMLSPIWQTKTATATKVRGRLEVVLDFAKAKGWRQGENPAAWKGNLSLFLPPLAAAREVRHFESLDAETLRKVLVPRLWTSGAISYLAILFGTLTALRAQEFLFARWDEIDGATFTVPWERIKTHKLSRDPFRVPLSRQALAVLDRVLGRDDEVVFPGQAGKYLSINTPRILIQRLTGTGATMHGMRSAFRDWCARQGVDFALAEKCLNHAVGGKVVQAYLRDDLLEERRAVMQAWADFLMPPESFAPGDRETSEP